MKACAYVVGPRDGPGAALRDLAQGLGFDAVLPFTGIANAEQQMAQTPLLFFLCAAVDDPRTLQPAAEAIRFCSSRKIRLSPLIYFSESPSLAVIKSCVTMGFDDVITFPFMPARVAERLAQQVDRSRVYVEEPGYFGPARAGQREAVGHQRPGGKWRRLEIIRSFADGVSVLRENRLLAGG